MSGTTNLWDVETGNSPGTYATEAEALAVARGLLIANGPEYAEALDLGCCDEDGRCEPVPLNREIAVRAEVR